MRKKVFICIMGSLYALILFSPSSTVLAENRQSSDSSVEEAGGERITCHCNGIWGRCKASGSGNNCAQSQPGGNVQCSKYNGNC